MVPVDRGARGKVMAAVMKRAQDEMATGRQLIIYPEGTRRPPGAPPEYKYGIARLYRDLNMPVVPVVMHPGLFWPRRKFLRYPGHFKVQILPPIEAGLDPDVFLKTLVDVMETASDALLVETVTNNPHLPLPPTAVQRLKELKEAWRLGLRRLSLNESSHFFQPMIANAHLLQVGKRVDQIVGIGS